MQPVQLVITVGPNGKVNVSGPLQDKILCYGLLEVARDIIQAQKSPGEQPGIVIASRLPPAPPNGR